MCHLIFLLPPAALILFWLIPFWIALPINLAVVALTVFVFYLLVKDRRIPQQTGSESMVGKTAEVATKLNSANPVKYLVRFQGELWSAISGDTLVPGEQVRIIAVDGIKLVVGK